MVTYLYIFIHVNIHVDFKPWLHPWIQSYPNHNMITTRLMVIFIQNSTTIMFIKNNFNHITNDSDCMQQHQWSNFNSMALMLSKWLGKFWLDGQFKICGKNAKSCCQAARCHQVSTFSSTPTSATISMSTNFALASSTAMHINQVLTTGVS